jgi:hypothetical protein
MGLLIRTIKAAWNEANKPETFVKGDEFEAFIRKYLFPHDDYDLLAKTHDYISNKNDFVQSSTEPDFKFRSRRNNNVFFVEAKYRSAYFDGAIEWCKSYQLTRYEAINRATPVYVVIGVGNLPSSPDHVFLVPVKRIGRYMRLFRSFLKEFEIPPNRGVSAEKLIGLLANISTSS